MRLLVSKLKSFGLIEAILKTLDVDIPAGINHGQTVILRGAGNHGANGGPAGDLRVGVAIKPHAFFERDGYNVWYDMRVSFVQAALGDKLRVPTLDGYVEYELPAGTQSGDIFKLKARGIPVLNSTRRGDQLIRVTVDVPKNLNDKQKELLMKFNEEMGANPIQPEEKKGFFGGKKKK